MSNEHQGMLESRCPMKRKSLRTVTRQQNNSVTQDSIMIESPDEVGDFQHRRLGNLNENRYGTRITPSSMDTAR